MLEMTQNYNLCYKTLKVIFYCMERIALLVERFTLLNVKPKLKVIVQTIYSSSHSDFCTRGITLHYRSPVACFIIWKKNCNFNCANNSIATSQSWMEAVVTVLHTQCTWRYSLVYFTRKQYVALQFHWVRCTNSSSRCMLLEVDAAPPPLPVSVTCGLRASGAPFLLSVRVDIILELWKDPNGCNKVKNW